MIATGKEYCEFLVADQKTKITGLENSIRDLEIELIRYRAVLTDAKRELMRLLAHDDHFAIGTELQPLKLD